MVIVGVMPVYEEADWVRWAVEGIIDFVDELVIAEGYQGPTWHFEGCRSKDGTINIIKELAKKYDKITLTECQPRVHVLNGKAATHNHALRVSKLIKKADWYMICDADEFYSGKQKEAIREVLETTMQDAFEVDARCFFYNFKNFIYVSLNRFFRVTEGMFFKPGQFPHYANGQEYQCNASEILLKDGPMFHYSFTKRPCCEIKRRVMEYCAVQRYRWVFDWIDQVYLQWTQENAEEIYELNRRRFNGQGGILFNGACDAQKLQVYEGKHPKVMDDHPYRHIEDIRKIHWPPKPAHKYITMRHRLSHYGLRLGRRVKSVYSKTKTFSNKTE